MYILLLHCYMLSLLEDELKDENSCRSRLSRSQMVDMSDSEFSTGWLPDFPTHCHTQVEQVWLWCSLKGRSMVDLWPLTQLHNITSLDIEKHGRPAISDNATQHHQAEHGIQPADRGARPHHISHHSQASLPTPKQTNKAGYMTFSNRVVKIAPLQG